MTMADPRTLVAIEEVVEKGREVPDCRHTSNTWCSCKVEWLAHQMVVMGWLPPFVTVPRPAEPTMDLLESTFGVDGPVSKKRSQPHLPRPSASGRTNEDGL